MYISYGQQEQKLSGHIDEFVTTLKSKQYPSVATIEHVVFDSAGHSDSFPIMGGKSIKWLSTLN
ncbi:hypothetical protein [Pseudoalteromonas sp. S16_S37]|uniref:hypothetical protein n=1 Tax=Pseudoalteromonas sp. S16_S37 TaxID=2720228 RepID=UPI001EED807F|nr:hypothetical protein [Pseudoalteromonas sp. S16_S37]